MKSGLTIILLLVFSGCASIRVVPKGCKTDAVFAPNPEASREVTYDEIENMKQEITAAKSFTVFSDVDVRIKDLLAKAGVKCDEVKMLRVKISTTWFVFREVQIKALRKNSGQGQGE